MIITKHSQLSTQNLQTSAIVKVGSLAGSPLLCSHGVSRRRRTAATLMASPKRLLCDPRSSRASQY